MRTPRPHGRRHRLPGPAGQVARPHLRRQPVDRRSLDVRLAACIRHELPPPGGQGRLLGADWDGKSLDSADHKSHVANPTGGACPADRPTALPAISLIYRYPISGDHDFALSSGGFYSAHADFFDAWNQSVLRTLVDVCLDGLRHCGRV